MRNIDKYTCPVTALTGVIRKDRKGRVWAIVGNHAEDIFAAPASIATSAEAVVNKIVRMIDHDCADLLALPAHNDLSATFAAWHAMNEATA